MPLLLSDWDGLRSGTAWFADGKTILLGIVGGYLGVEVAKRLLNVRIKTGDTFAVPVAVAIGIGRRRRSASTYPIAECKPVPMVSHVNSRPKY